MSEPPPEDAPLAALARSDVLSYATLDADGLPAFVAEAEAAIDARRSVRQIGKFFRRRPDVNKYIVKSFRRRFDLRTVSGLCVECLQETSFVAQLLWTFQGVASFVGFRLSDRDLIVHVRTWHSYCPECVAAWYRRVRWALLLRRVGSWMTIASFVLVIARHAFWRRSSSQMDGFLIGYISILAAGLIVGAVGAIGFAWNVPRKLRALVPRWMKYAGVAAYSTRDELFAAGEQFDAGGSLLQEDRQPT